MMSKKEESAWEEEKKFCLPAALKHRIGGSEEAVLSQTPQYTYRM